MSMGLHRRELLLASCFAVSAIAADLHGTIIIEKRLTRPNLTAPISSYGRGVAVKLGESSQDALGFERSHVAIYIEGSGTATEPVKTSIEQRGREFVPDMVVAPVGSTISFPNLDPIFHNVFSLSKPRAFDLGNYPRGQSKDVTFPKPGIVFVYCHLHSNMEASIVISPNGWATRADAAGHFTLAGVPPGKYTVTAWHKSAGFFRKTVVVDGDTAPDLQFLIPLRDDGTDGHPRSK
jgi:plastocyanin